MVSFATASQPKCFSARTLPAFPIELNRLALAIISEATLSFLGVGMPPTSPSLGTLIRTGNNFLFSGEWWITLFPSLTLVLLASLTLVLLLQQVPYKGSLPTAVPQGPPRPSSWNTVRSLSAKSSVPCRPCSMT